MCFNSSKDDIDNDDDTRNIDSNSIEKIIFEAAVPTAVEKCNHKNNGVRDFVPNPTNVTRH